MHPTRYLVAFVHRKRLGSLQSKGIEYVTSCKRPSEAKVLCLAKDYTVTLEY